MTDISHEEMGSSCDCCGNGGSLCTCKRCVDCEEKYDVCDLNYYGFCPDCWDDFSTKTLEDKLERALEL
jgi:hypothetical protein